MRKTKIVATIGPTSNTQEAIIELGDKGVNVCRLNMSHGDHASHEAVVDKIKYYNSLDRGCLAILLDTKVLPATPSIQTAQKHHLHAMHAAQAQTTNAGALKGRVFCPSNLAAHGRHAFSKPQMQHSDHMHRALSPECSLQVLQGPEVRSGDLTEPADLVRGDEWVFTIKEGETGADRRISVNYDGFVQDVSEGDVLLVDGGIQTFEITNITSTDVICKVRPSHVLQPAVQHHSKLTRPAVQRPKHASGTVACATVVAQKLVQKRVWPVYCRWSMGV